MERLALECWNDGPVKGGYEIDHEALTSKPYVSLRKIKRWTEEIDRKQEREAEREAGREAKRNKGVAVGRSKLDDFLKEVDDLNDGD